MHVTSIAIRLLTKEKNYTLKKTFPFRAQRTGRVANAN